MKDWIPISIVAAYLVALFGVTWWARRLGARSGGGMMGYLLAGRQLPFWVAAPLLAGLVVGGASTVGVAEKAYSGAGISAGWYNAAWAFGAFVVAFTVARRYRRFELTTLPELFERCYSTTARVLGVIGQLVIQMVITSLQIKAGETILRALLPEIITSPAMGMIVTALVFLGITLIGGFWAAGLTNVINVTVIYVGLVLCTLFTLDRMGGLAGLEESLHAGIAAGEIAPNAGFDFFALGLGALGAYFLVTLTTVHSTQSVVQIGLSARDERNASWSYLLGGLLILPVGFLSAIIGLAAAVEHPELTAARDALPEMAQGFSQFSGIILAGLWAADVSTASAMLMGSAALVSGDLVKRFLAPNLSARQDQRLCRAVVIVLTVLTLLLAMTFEEGILNMLLIGLSLTAGYTLIVLATMYTPGLCRRSSASWTLATTIAALFARVLAPASWGLPHPIYTTLLVGLATFLLVALLDHRHIDRVPGNFSSGD